MVGWEWKHRVCSSSRPMGQSIGLMPAKKEKPGFLERERERQNKKKPEQNKWMGRNTDSQQMDWKKGDQRGGSVLLVERERPYSAEKGSNCRKRERKKTVSNRAEIKFPNQVKRTSQWAFFTGVQNTFLDWFLMATHTQTHPHLQRLKNVLFLAVNVEMSLFFFSKPTPLEILLFYNSGGEIVDKSQGH